MALSQATLELLVKMKDEASSGLGSLGNVLGTVGGVAGGVALAGFTAFAGAVVAGIGDAREAAQVMAQTEAVIKSTGGAAGFTAEQIGEMAGQLSAAEGMSLFGDSDIQKGQNLLLTFTNIKETLPDATQTMLDMAQALGTDVSGGAIQLGKALNDPIAGISALSRVGVTFTEEQKAQIKAMQDAGDMAGAQQVILAELNKEFGGSAKAAAEADGGMAQFTDRLGEAKETLGAAVLPLLNLLIGALNDHILPLVESGASLFADFVGGLQSSGEATGFLSGLLATVAPIFDQVYAAAQDVFNTLITEGKPILDDLGTIAIPLLTGAGEILAALWTNVLAPTLSQTWYIIKTYLLPGIGLLIHALSVVLPPIIETVSDVFSTVLLPALGMVIDGIDLIGQGIEAVIDWFGQLGSAIGSITIPSWLQGHSPPPLANWFSDIAGAAESAGGAVEAVAPPGGTIPSLPAFGATGAFSGAGGGTVVYVTVQGNVTTERDLVLAIRDSLNQIGRQNLSIFSADVTA